MIKLSTGVIHRLWDSPKTTLNVASYLTYSVRSRLADEPVCRVARARCMVLLAALCIVGTVPATAAQDVKTTSIDSLKLYAHSKIINDKQYQCLYKLITVESHWNTNAQSGRHYGLGQMNNESYRNLDGFRQIDWTIKYIKHRHGSMCNAYRHWQKHGWH